MEPYHKRKKLLEETYGKLIIFKPYNDDVGIANNKQQEFVKQLQNTTEEEGLKRVYEQEMGYTSSIIDYSPQAQRTFHKTI